MQTRTIGSLDATVVGLGCNNFGTRIDAGATARVVEAALQAGIRFFDTADIYGGGRSEEDRRERGQGAGGSEHGGPRISSWAAGLGPRYGAQK